MSENKLCYAMHIHWSQPRGPDTRPYPMVHPLPSDLPEECLEALVEYFSEALKEKVNPDLASCPYCGSSVEFVEFRKWNMGDDYYYWISCNKCEGYTVKEFSSKQAAAKWWNGNVRGEIND